MSSRTFEGLQTAWGVSSMSTTFPGGLWLGKAKKDCSWPHVTMLDLGDARTFGTSGGEDGQAEFRSHEFQVNIWLQADGSNDPSLQLGSLMRTFDSFIQSHNRTLYDSVTEGRVLQIQNLDERLEQTDDERVWQGQIDYRASWMRKVTA